MRKAEEYFTAGYNCCQAVAAAFSDVAGLPEETLLRLSCPFGGGFARLRYVCGAVSGMGLIAGLVYGDGTPDCKKQMYPKIRELSDAFEARFGSIVCSELLRGMGSHNDPPVPDERTPQYYHRRSCLDCVKAAAEILAKDLEANEHI
ncbi:MAG: C_GCAxxG_C_C family protein [Clostridia bacterium]|nr:C_GCAxxG_C_C family protein [Clostridia bacterium]